MTSGWRERVINEGTAFETVAYRFDADRDGPTAVVVGGQHGIEPAGWLAAEELLEYEPQAGTLVVIPRMDPTAIAASAYVGALGADMNSCWLTNRPLQHKPVHWLWETIQEVDPDVVIDLHSSSGIYNGTPDGVGQVIFPTPDGSSIASRVCDRLTREHVSPAGYGSGHAYRRGNILRGSGTKLARKARSDLGAMAFICEPTRHGTTLDDRIEWNLASARYLLEECGMAVN